MKSKDMLRKIYYENKAMNRNIEQLANIGLISLLAKSAKEAKVSGDEQGKKLAKVGLILVLISEILIMISGFLEHREMKIEEKLEKYK